MFSNIFTCSFVQLQKSRRVDIRFTLKHKTSKLGIFWRSLTFSKSLPHKLRFFICYIFSHFDFDLAIFYVSFFPENLYDISKW